MDPLSDVLSLLKPRSYVSAGFDAGGDWSIRFADLLARIKCYAVISGSAWLAVEDVAEPVRLESGDCFVLPSGRPFRLASDLDLPSIESGLVFPPSRPGGVVTMGGGGGFFIVGSRFAVNGQHAGDLLRALPPIVHIRREQDRAALRWSVESMMQELREARPGNVLISEHLAHMMLVQALRLYLEDGAQGRVGWFFALADRQMSAAISAMHADPGRSWTLQDLAGQAGMSRSAFAMKFRATVGETPIDYLTRWRMLLAADRLTNANETVAEVALSIGYRSEAAFSTAFKRVMACSPREYCKRSGKVHQMPDPIMA